MKLSNPGYSSDYKAQQIHVWFLLKADRFRLSLKEILNSFSVVISGGVR